MKPLSGLAACSLVLLLAVSTAATDPAPPISGTTMLDWCRTFIRLDEQRGVGAPADDAGVAGVCLGFIYGMAEMHNVYRALYPQAATIFCLPRGFTGRQGARVVVRYLDTHPERLHEPGAGLIIEALREAFPCPTPPAQPPRKR